MFEEKLEEAEEVAWTDKVSYIIDALDNNQHVSNHRCSRPREWIEFLTEEFRCADLFRASTELYCPPPIIFNNIFSRGYVPFHLYISAFIPLTKHNRRSIAVVLTRPDLVGIYFMSTNILYLSILRYEAVSPWLCMHLSFIDSMQPFPVIDTYSD